MALLSNLKRRQDVSLHVERFHEYCDFAIKSAVRQLGFEAIIQIMIVIPSSRTDDDLSFQAVEMNSNRIPVKIKGFFNPCSWHYA